MVIFSETLKAARHTAKLTQKQTTELLCGVPLRTYQAWEGGTRIPAPWCQRLILDKIHKYIMEWLHE